MNAITQQLADSVRLNLAGHFSVQKQTEALAAFDAAKDAPDAVQPNLQPLHDLVKKWTKFSETYDDYYICLEELKEAIAKLQTKKTPS